MILIKLKYSRIDQKYLLNELQLLLTTGVINASCRLLYERNIRDRQKYKLHPNNTASVKET